LVSLHLGDCLDVLRTLDDNSVDAIVTDPPYELGFMGRDWDRSGIANDVTVWAECLRVIKPGGFLASFGGTRTYHRMACAVEDAGFEIRDSLHWLYGSGFPKSLDVGKAIDKAAGAEREVVGLSPHSANRAGVAGRGMTVCREGGDLPAEADRTVTAPATDAAQQWDGWGTALKPAHEPIVLARKPLVGSVAANVLAWGVGGLHVDACRVGESWVNPWAGSGAGHATANADGVTYGKGVGGVVATPHPAGRWPSNVLFTHDPSCNGVCVVGCPVGELDHQSGTSTSTDRPRHNTAAAHNNTASMGKSSADWTTAGHADSGGASRFFPVFRYQAKAPTSERPKIDGKGWPTVKPLALMEWLVRLITPPGGTVLDPFAGTGTTLQAARRQGFRAIGIERDELAHQLATQRLEGDTQDTLFGAL
jgi:site-specific DNA-methyltransferase (adenine-specific)